MLRLFLNFNFYILSAYLCSIKGFFNIWNIEIWPSFHLLFVFLFFCIMFIETITPDKSETILYSFLEHIKRQNNYYQRGKNYIERDRQVPNIYWIQTLHKKFYCGRLIFLNSKLIRVFLIKSLLNHFSIALGIVLTANS